MMFLQVPVANGSGSYPFSIDVPRNTRFLFANRSVTPSKAIAKSIVSCCIICLVVDLPKSHGQYSNRGFTSNAGISFETW